MLRETRRKILKLCKMIRGCRRRAGQDIETVRTGGEEGRDFWLGDEMNVATIPRNLANKAQKMKTNTCLKTPERSPRKNKQER